MTKEQKKTIKDWKKLILPETPKTSKIDAQNTSTNEIWRFKMFIVEDTFYFCSPYSQILQPHYVSPLVLTSILGRLSLLPLISILGGLSLLPLISILGGLI